jgi:hypothetical protein
MVSPDRMNVYRTGVQAWWDGKPYRDSKPGRRKVYHVRADCPAGVRIEIQHLRAGQGTRQNICKKCHPQQVATK